MRRTLAVRPPRWLCLGLTLLLAVPGGWAATLTVCASGCDFSSIQGAVNAAAPGDTLDLAAETFFETVSVAKDLMIQGAGPLVTVVDGGTTGSVFTVDGASVTLRGLTARNGGALNGGGISTIGTGADVRLIDVHVRNNAAAAVGGGIHNPDGSVTITRNLIAENTVPGMDNAGGGVFNAGTMTIRDSLIRDNDAWLGGGIYSSGDLTLDGSTLQSNDAEFGGAISTSGGNLTMRDCTVSGNSANEGGGFCVGLFETFEKIAITRSTIAENTANVGGGIFDYSQVGTIELESTILSGNTGGNCHPPTGVFSSSGHNLESASSCNLTETTDQTGVDPLLATLADNGGPTPTHALGAGSPAIDSGAPGCDPVDQRGEARPVDGDLDGSIRCDVGAYERTCAGAYRPDPTYGRLLFAPRCTADASTLPGSPGQPHVYDTVQLPFFRGPRDRVLLVAAPAAEFARVVADDELRVNGISSGLGPYLDQPGKPPYTLGVPIQANRVPEPSQELDTTLVPLGASTPTFDLVDTDRQIYGNMAIYLALDCGIVLEGKSPTTIRFLSRDDAEAGVPPVFDVISGFFGDLRATGDFSLATCLIDSGTSPAQDFLEDPPPGQGRYYLARGVSSCLAQGFGDASPSLSPDPRDDLDTLNPCP
jgi:hypothetical protein